MASSIGARAGSRQGYCMPDPDAFPVVRNTTDRRCTRADGHAIPSPLGMLCTSRFVVPRTRRRVAHLPPGPYEDVDRTVRVVRVKRSPGEPATPRTHCLFRELQRPEGPPERPLVVSLGPLAL